MHPNMRRLTILGLSVLVWLSVVGAPAMAAKSGRYLDPIFSVYATRNLVYGHAHMPDGTLATLKLDLYRPYGDTALKRPVVIFVHGGGSDGSKNTKRNRDISIGWARRGFVAATIDYRPDQKSGSTAGAQYDTRAAVRWFKAHAAQYRVNPNWIFLMGSSFGALNVLNVGFNPEDPGDSGSQSYSSTVAAVIAVSGYASEAWNIGLGEPPIAMVHAMDDRTVPISSELATCAQTTAMGNVCDFYRYDSGGHPPQFLIDNQALVQEQTAQFLCKRVLGPVVCHDPDGDGKVG